MSSKEVTQRKLKKVEADKVAMSSKEDDKVAMISQQCKLEKVEVLSLGERVPKREIVQRKDPGDWTEMDVEKEFVYVKKQIGKNIVRYIYELKKQVPRIVCINFVIRSVERNGKSENFFRGEVEYGASIFQRDKPNEVFVKKFHFKTAKERVTRFSVPGCYAWTNLENLATIIRQTLYRRGVQIRHPREAILSGV